MKVLVFNDFDLGINKYDLIYVSDENEFYTRVINNKYDVVIVSFKYFPEFLEVKNYIDAKVIFLVEYCDVHIYKKVLEFGDYCYLYTEIEKLKIRLSYLQKIIFNLKTSIYKSKKFLYNFITKQLYFKSKLVKLSKAQIEIIEILIKNRNHYISKETILENCDNIENLSSIKVLISSIRKLGIEIENQKNLGYKLKE